MTRCALAGGGDRLKAVEALLRAAGADPVHGAGAAASELGADLIFVDVEPDRMTATLGALAPGPRDQVVIVSRGLDGATGRRLSELVEAQTACVRVGALAGPLLLGEIERGAPSAVLVASPFHSVTQAAHDALRSPVCQVYRTEDLTGTELAGALVEVLCAALGAARGLGAGVGLQALAVSRGIAEGGQLFTRVGGQARTFSGLAGVGELIAAASVTDHPSLRRGLALARGERDAALVTLCDALLKRVRDLPITQGVRAVANGDGTARSVLQALLERDPGAE